MNPYEPSAAAARLLSSQLTSFASLPYAEHDARTELAAATFSVLVGSFAQGPFVRFDRMRLAVLTHRWAFRRGRLRARAPLAIYVPYLDLPGSGRVRFVLEDLCDLRDRALPEPGGALDPLNRFPAAQLAVQMALAVEDAEPYELVVAPAFPRYFWAFCPGRAPAAPEGVAAHEWEAERVAIGSHLAWPALHFTAAGGPVPERYWPDVVYALPP